MTRIAPGLFGSSGMPDFPMGARVRRARSTWFSRSDRAKVWFLRYALFRTRRWSSRPPAHWFLGVRGSLKRRPLLGWGNRRHQECGMGTTDRSCVIPLAEAQAGIPGPAGEHAMSVLRRGTLKAMLSLGRFAPLPRPTTPHAQDEVYIIIRGRGVFLHDGRRDPFEPGD